MTNPTPDTSLPNDTPIYNEVKLSPIELGTTYETLRAIMQFAFQSVTTISRSEMFDTRAASLVICPQGEYQALLTSTHSKRAALYAPLENVLLVSEATIAAVLEANGVFTPSIRGFVIDLLQAQLCASVRNIRPNKRKDDATKLLHIGYARIPYTQSIATRHAPVVHASIQPESPALQTLRKLAPKEYTTEGVTRLLAHHLYIMGIQGNSGRVVRAVYTAQNASASENATFSYTRAEIGRIAPMLQYILSVGHFTISASSMRQMSEEQLQDIKRIRAILAVCKNSLVSIQTKHG